TNEPSERLLVAVGRRNISEARSPRSLGGAAADRQHRQPNEFQAARMARECMRRIGAGHRHCIPRPRTEIALIEPPHPQNGREDHLAAARTQLLRRALCIGFRSSDENPHGVHASAKKPAPARSFSSRPASWPSADACVAAPSRVVSNTWLPSGLAIRPRKLTRPAATLA